MMRILDYLKFMSVSCVYQYVFKCVIVSVCEYVCGRGMEEGAKVCGLVTQI